MVQLHNISTRCIRNWSTNRKLDGIGTLNAKRTTMKNFSVSFTLHFYLGKYSFRLDTFLIYLIEYKKFSFTTEPSGFVKHVSNKLNPIILIYRIFFSDIIKEKIMKYVLHVSMNVCMSLSLSVCRSLSLYIYI